MTARLVVIGDSHTAALELGRRAMIAAGREAEVEPIVVRDLGPAQFGGEPYFQFCGDHIEITHPEYRPQIERLPIPGMETARIGISQPFWSMRLVKRLIISERRCFYPVPAPRPAKPDWTPVTRSLFRRLVLEDQRYNLALIEHLRDLGADPLVVSGPTMFAHNWAAQAGRKNLGLELTTEYRDVMANELAARGISVVDLPPGCIGPDGYMLPKFRDDDPEDPCHGNAAFGQLMFERLLEVVAD